MITFSGNFLRNISASLALIIFGFSVSIAQDALSPLRPDKKLTQFNIVPWNLEKGLQSSAILDIIQTRDRYIWLATFDGLTRFDGYNFNVYDNTNTPAFIQNGVECLFEDESGTLWIGTHGGGIVKYDKGKFRTNNTASFSYSIINDFYQDRGGNIWVGTDKRLLKIADGRILNVMTERNVNVDVRAISEDDHGNIWVGSYDQGIFKIKYDTLMVRSSSHTLKDRGVQDMHCDNRGIIWVGTESGLFLMQDEQVDQFDLSEDFNSRTTVNCFFEDRNNSVWIGTADGLFRWNAGKTEVLNNENGLPDDNIRSIAPDSEGNLWVGTYRGGMVQVRDGKFTNYGTSEGLVGNAVNAVKATDSLLWVATQDGISKMNLSTGKFTNYKSGKNLEYGFIRDLVVDSVGDIWFATYGNGIGKLEDSTVTETFDAYRHGLADDWTRRLFIHKKKLWVGTKNGLSMFGKDTVKHWSGDETKLSSGYIMDIKHTEEHGLIVATNNGGGLNFIKREGSIEHFDAERGLSGNVVFCVFEDKDKVLWIGTNHGITRVENGNAAQITARDGLISDAIYQITEDRSGFLWVTCNRGIFKVSKEEISRFVVGRTGRIRSTVFDKNDGLKNNEITVNGNISVLNDGRFVFSTLSGIAIINPDSVVLNHIKPPVYINNIEVDGKRFEIGKDKTVYLNENFNRLAINYSALSFRAPGKVAFQYKLTPFDKDWVSPTNKRSAFFTRLPSGTYTFRVIACNNDGIWNTEGAELKVVVRQPFYKEAWLYILVVILLIPIGFVLAVRYSYWVKKIPVDRLNKKVADYLRKRGYIEQV